LVKAVGPGADSSYSSSNCPSKFLVNNLKTSKKFTKQQGPYGFLPTMTSVNHNTHIPLSGGGPNVQGNFFQSPDAIHGKEVALLPLSRHRSRSYSPAPGREVSHRNLGSSSECGDVNSSSGLPSVLHPSSRPRYSNNHCPSKFQLNITSTSTLQTSKKFTKQQETFGFHPNVISLNPNTSIPQGVLRNKTAEMSRDRRSC